jgi:hypothetical protein
MNMKDWFRKWFKQSQSDPWLIQTPMVRSKEQIQAFLEWKKGPRAQVLLDDLLRAYEFHGLGIETTFRFNKLHSQGAEGVYFVPASDWSNKDASDIYEWICWFPLNLGYIEAHSEQKTNWVNPAAGQREFRYFKPFKSVNIGEDVPQLFGNLIAERMLVDGKTQWIKIVGQFYQGRPYTQVQPFSEFLDLVFSFEQGLKY